MSLLNLPWGAMVKASFSVKEATEMGLVIDSSTMSGQLAVALDQIAPTFAYEVTLSKQGRLQWIDTPEVTHNHEPQTSFALRVLVHMLGWLPIDWLL